MFTKERETVCFKRKFLEENKFSTPCFPLITLGDALAEFTEENFRLSPFQEIAAPTPVHELNNYVKVFVGIEVAKFLGKSLWEVLVVLRRRSFHA
ncbi:uncharacterized protein TNCV_2686501 [Trichonephila clavipes]|nr:uncharacterized protein TNCV_2686501 [Trichonephila clavipes]